MSDRRCRSGEKESYWRGHVERQSSSGESIRGYCRGRSLSEASFHFWRRELGVRDREATGKRGIGSAGLIAVEITEDVPLRAMLEIECPGGAVVRLREDVSVDVLERVLRACGQVRSTGASAAASVRSC
jgi:hypothetical protein